MVSKSKADKSAGLTSCLMMSWNLRILYLQKTKKWILRKMFSFKFDTNTTLFIWRCVIYPILKVKSSDSIHAISLHYRGISLQCAAAKIYSSVLKNRFEGISHALNTSTFVTFIDLQKDWFRCNVGVWQEDSYTQHYSLYLKKI